MSSFVGKLYKAALVVTAVGVASILTFGALCMVAAAVPSLPILGAAASGILGAMPHAFGIAAVAAKVAATSTGAVGAVVGALGWVGNGLSTGAAMFLTMVGGKLVAQSVRIAAASPEKPPVRQYRQTGYGVISSSPTDAGTREGSKGKSIEALPALPLMIPAIPRVIGSGNGIAARQRLMGMHPNLMAPSFY